MKENRRIFLERASKISLGLCLCPGFVLPGTWAVPASTEKKIPMIGIQMGPHSFYDEGIDRVLDFLQQEAAVNTLMIYSHTYYDAGSRPLHVLAGDHGVAPRNENRSNLTRVWVRHHDQYFRDTCLRHHTPDEHFEYSGKDLFEEIRAPAAARAMKVFARILEVSAGNGLKYIENFDRVLTRDIFGNPGGGPCWNHPDYRRWIYGTIDDMFHHYPLDGIQYGAERTGPLSRLLFQGIIPDCFCEHCCAINTARNIDPERAREGYTQLYAYIKKVESDEDRSPESVMVNILRFLQQYPELLAWNYQWFRADEEIHQELYARIRRIQPKAVVGRHVDHQRSSWDIFYRSAVTYEEMTESADFIKPILYHDIYGPRLRWWVIERMGDRALRDLPREQALDLFYAWMGYSQEARVALAELDQKGMGPAYVYDETRRCVEGVKGKAEVIAGIGIDVPWHAPGGLQPFPSDPEKLQQAVFKAAEAGADGLLASREYDEMRHSSLRAFGSAAMSAFL